MKIFGVMECHGVSERDDEREMDSDQQREKGSDRDNESERAVVREGERSRERERESTIVSIQCDGLACSEFIT